MGLTMSSENVCAYHMHSTGKVYGVFDVGAGASSFKRFMYKQARGLTMSSENVCAYRMQGHW